MLEISNQISIYHSWGTFGGCRTPEISLEVDLSSDLNWNDHIAGIIGKASRSLGFIRRDLNKCPENVKEQAYLALVSPQLEYGCRAWHPHIQKQIKDIERIQRRAAQSCRNCHETFE